MTSDPRRNVSSSYAGRPNAQDDLDWLSFLRTAGNTVPADPRPPPPDRSDSADRKRRHTGSEPERRNYRYPNHHGRSGLSNIASGSGPGTGHQGSSRETAIDLTTPPRPSRPRALQMPQGSNGGINTGRRESDVTLPRWQPDHQVSRCPVCSTDFSFLFRRHHCRKCGRVVCANCSPHRITIPRQYIVQPPNYDEEASSPEFRGNSGLGGGEIVRVCRPCIPDPWTGPAAVTNAPAPPAPVPPPPPSTNRSLPSQFHTRDPRLNLHLGQNTREGNAEERPERYRYMSELGMGRSRSNTHQPTTTNNHPQRVPTGGMPSQFMIPGQDAPHPRLAQRYGHRYSHSTSDRPMPPNRPPPNIPVAPPPAPPRREVREEDECPVCGIEMEPGESVREAHIQECIASRFSSTPSQQTRSAPPPADAVAPPPTELAGTPASSSSSPPPVPEGSRPRATSYRPRGMALYRATEKDCTTEDGEPQECVICFEEFQPGDEMGRMECLCKFHRQCIRQWWDTKGQGSCPTHQLHD